MVVFLFFSFFWGGWERLCCSCCCVLVSGGLWDPGSSSTRVRSPCKLLSSIPYVGGRKVRCMLAGSYLGGTQWSKLAVLCRDLYVSRQRMGWYDLRVRKRTNFNWINNKYNRSKIYLRFIKYLNLNMNLLYG